MYIVLKKVPDSRYPLYFEKFKNRTDFAMLMRADYGDDAASCVSHFFIMQDACFRNHSSTKFSRAVPKYGTAVKRCE